MKRTTFELLLPLARGDGDPLRIQVLRELRAAINDGRLRAGLTLPATRVFAAELGVSRGVLVAAYEQLILEGYLESRRGSATRVADRRTATGPTLATAQRPAGGPVPVYDFRPGVPDMSLFPLEAWLRAIRRSLTAPDASVLDYPDPQGVHVARDAIAAYLNRSRATVASPDRIVMATGFAQAARLVAESLYARGIRRIAVEDPGHVEQCSDVRAAGLELVPVPVDRGGIRVDRLNRLSVGAVLVTPAHQYPTGSVLAADRRAQLLEWAERKNTFVLEDDYDAEYRFDRDPIGALQGLSPERVIYMGSASKMLVPSLRLGWLVLPSSLVGGVTQAKLSADRGSPALEQLALASFLEAGELDRHLRRTRAIYRRRRDVLVAAIDAHLPEAVIHGISAGIHLLLELPADTDEEEAVSGAAACGVRVYGASAYHADPSRAAPSLLMGYGAIGEEKIDNGVKILAGAVREASSRSGTQHQ